MQEEFPKDETQGPDIYGFGVLSGAEEEFWGTVPGIKGWNGGEGRGGVPDGYDLRSHWP